MPHPNDVDALRRYTEAFDYDAVGNITSMAHIYNGGGWTRRYAYAPGTNGLSRPQPAGRRAGRALLGDLPARRRRGDDPDAHLATLGWDHAGHLEDVDLGGGGAVTYQYDGMR